MPYITGSYHLAISAFLEPHHHHKASNHPTISKLICHFHLQHPPTHKHFDSWNVEQILSVLESWVPVSFTNFKLVWKTSSLLQGSHPVRKTWNFKKTFSSQGKGREIGKFGPFLEKSGKFVNLYCL